MKKLLTLAVIFLVLGGGESVLGQPYIPPSPSTPRLMIAPDGTLVSDANPLPTKITGAEVSIELGDLSLETIPSYEDTLGSPTRALLDANKHQLINFDDVLDEIASLSLDISSSKTAISTAVGDVETAVEAVETEIASGNVTINESILEVKDAVDTLAASVDVDKISDFSATVITVSAETGAAIVMPDLGTARTVFIFSDKDVNFGGAGVGTGDAEPYIPGGAPFVKFRFSTNTPAFYFRGRSETASIRIWAAEE